MLLTMQNVCFLFQIIYVQSKTRQHLYHYLCRLNHTEEGLELCACYFEVSDVKLQASQREALCI